MDIMNCGLNQKLRNDPNISTKVNWMNNDATNFNRNVGDMGFESNFQHVELRSSK